MGYLFLTAKDGSETIINLLHVKMICTSREGGSEIRMSDGGYYTTTTSVSELKNQVVQALRQALFGLRGV